MLSPPNCNVLFLPIIFDELLFFGLTGADADDIAPLLAGGLPPSVLVGPFICGLLFRLGSADEAP